MDTNIKVSKADAEATRRAFIILLLRESMAERPRMDAYGKISAVYDVSQTTLWRWNKKIGDLHPAEWKAVLMPKWRGHRQSAAFSEEAWAYIKLNRGQSSLAAVYRRCASLAKENGWDLPSINTVERRVNKEFGAQHGK